MAPRKKNKTKESKSQEASKTSRANSKPAGSESKEQQQEAVVQVSLALHDCLKSGVKDCHASISTEDLQINSGLESQPPADEVPYTQAFWDVLTEQQRQELLTVNHQQLQQTAVELLEAVNTHPRCSLEHAMLLCQGKRTKMLWQVLEQGMGHLKVCQTNDLGCKRWRWPNEHQEFGQAGLFREHFEANHIDPQLLEFLPTGDAVAAEAEALWTRMAGLFERVCTIQNTYRDGGPDDHIPLRSSELITTILAAFEEEHAYMYQFMLFPVIFAVCTALPESERRATTATNLSYCDLEKLPRQVLLHICNWLTAGVNMLSKLKSESIGGDNWPDKEGLAANISVTREGHKFCLSPRDNTQVQLEPSWYEYLKELGLVRKDTDNIDYRLQWVLGLVYDHDSYQAWNQSAVGNWVPTVQWAHQRLLSTLHDMKEWQTRAEESKKLLREMLVSRRTLAEIKLKHDASPRPDKEKHEHSCELPDHVVIALLRHEALLVKVRVHYLKIQHIMDKEHLRHLRAKQSQSEPEFKRLDAALDAEHPGAKAQDRLDLVTDSGLAEKCKRLGATMLVYEAEADMVLPHIKSHEAGLKELAEWSGHCMHMASSIGRVAAFAASASSGWPQINGLQEGVICPCCNSLSCTGLAAGRKEAMRAYEQQAEQFREMSATLKHSFQTDIRPQLQDEAEHQNSYNLTQEQLKQIEKRMLQGQAVLPLLENYVINLACDDPGAVIGPQLILPTLRRQLLARAHEFHHAQKTTQQEAAALLASQELLAEEEREQARAAAKKAKKEQTKAKSRAKPAVSQESVQEQPPLYPDSHVQLPSTHTLQETKQQHKYDELFTRPTSAGDKSLANRPATSAKNGHEFDPSSASSGTTSMGPTNQAGWCQTGEKGSVLAAHLAEAPAMVTESVSFELGTPNGSSAESSGFAAESSRLAPQGSGLATGSCNSSNCPSGSTLEQTVVHLMLCPLTQAVMRDPVIAADGHTYERAAMQKWLHHHQSSPVTGEALMHVLLVPNIVIRNVIEKHLL